MFHYALNSVIIWPSGWSPVATVIPEVSLHQGSLKTNRFPSIYLFIRMQNGPLGRKNVKNAITYYDFGRFLVIFIFYSTSGKETPCFSCLLCKGRPIIDFLKSSLAFTHRCVNTTPRLHFPFWPLPNDFLVSTKSPFSALINIQLEKFSFAWPELSNSFRSADLRISDSALIDIIDSRKAYVLGS